jgi:hypothetical protein
MAIRRKKSTQPAQTAAVTRTKKTPKRPRTPASAKKALKGLDDLIQQCMKDEAFIEALKADPAKALRNNGYPATAPLVRQIRAIDFDVFRRAFQPGLVQWC